MTLVSSTQDASLPAPRVTRVDGILATIDFADRVAVGNFGVGAQRAASASSDRVVEIMEAEKGADADAVLALMLSKANELDPASVRSPTGFLARLFAGRQDRISNFKRTFSDVARAIDQMAIKIERHREDMRSDISTLEHIYGETVASIEDLDDHIAAGDKAAKEMREVTIPALKAQMDGATTDGMMRAQRAMDAEQAADRLEKRVLQLRQARQIAFQQLPQIRLVQSGDETLIENLSSALDLTIPAWKQKMVVVLGIARQGQALETDRKLADATGRMMRETAALVRSQAFEIEERSQSGIVDIQALEETNAILVDTLNGLIERRANGRNLRRETADRIETMRDELQAAIAAPDASAIMKTRD